MASAYRSRQQSCLSLSRLRALTSRPPITRPCTVARRCSRCE